MNDRNDASVIDEIVDCTLRAEPPATPFDAAVLQAARDGRLVFVAFDRGGRPLPVGTLVDGSGNLHDVDGRPFEYDATRSVATTPFLELDAARTRHRSACEEKRRRAFTNGLITGLVVGAVVIVLLAWVAAYIYAVVAL